MVTMKDVFESSLISELRLRAAETVNTGTPLKEVADLMCDRKIGCVPIVKDDKIIGIFSERDWLNRVLRQGISLDQPVDDVMTTKPATITRRAGIWEAAEIMGQKKVRHLPIVNDDQTVHSMISVRDILRYLAECFPEQFLAHPPDSNKITLQAEGG